MHTANIKCLTWYFFYFLEYSLMSKFDPDESDSDYDAAKPECRLSDIRVIAQVDHYPAPGSDDLPFKAGKGATKTEFSFFKNL